MIIENKEMKKLDNETLKNITGGYLILDTRSDGYCLVDDVTGRVLESGLSLVKAKQAAKDHQLSGNLITLVQLYNLREHGSIDY